MAAVVISTRAAARTGIPCWLSQPLLMLRAPMVTYWSFTTQWWQRYPCEILLLKVKGHTTAKDYELQLLTLKQFLGNIYADAWANEAAKMVQITQPQNDRAQQAGDLAQQVMSRRTACWDF